MTLAQCRLDTDRAAMLSNYWDNKNNQSVNKMGEGKRGYWEEAEGRQSVQIATEEMREIGRCGVVKEIGKRYSV